MTEPQISLFTDRMEILSHGGLLSEMTAEEIAIEVGVTKRTIERTLVSLKKKGLIERIGSNKNGSWAVVK